VASFAQVLFSLDLTLKAQFCEWNAIKLGVNQHQGRRERELCSGFHAQMTHRQQDCLFRDLELIQESFSSRKFIKVSRIPRALQFQVFE
jgi:hypothetical protein